VRQFIYVSALGADESSPIELPRAKALTEEYLRASGLTYTILAPNGILEVLLSLVVDGPLQAGRPVTLVGAGMRRHSFVSATDIAAFAVAAAGHPAARNRRIPIGGPQAISWRDIVAAYERVLGHDIPINSIAPGELLPDLPPVPGLAEFLSGLLAGLETFDSPLDMSEATTTFNVRLTSLEAVVHGQVARLPVSATRS
jgi:NADH dehydrogenase